MLIMESTKYVSNFPPFNELLNEFYFMKATTIIYLNFQALLSLKYLSTMVKPQHAYFMAMSHHNIQLLKLYNNLFLKSWHRFEKKTFNSPLIQPLYCWLIQFISVLDPINTQMLKYVGQCHKMYILYHEATSNVIKSVQQK